MTLPDLSRGLDAPGQREEEHYPEEEKAGRQAPVGEADAVADVILHVQDVMAVAEATRRWR